MTEKQPYRPDPMARGLIVGAFLSVFLIAAGYVFWIHPQSPSGWDDEQWQHVESGAEFPPLQIDDSQLASARQQFAGEFRLELIEDELDALVDATHRMNQIQFDLQGRELHDRSQQLVQELQYLANDVVLVTHPQGFQLSGEPIFENCLAGLEELLAAVRAGDISIEEAAAAPPEGRFELYRSNCGNLLGVLVNRGIVAEDGTWSHPAGPQLTDVFQRYRWVHNLLGDKYQMHRLLSPDELEVLYRWRIEDDEAFEPHQRRRYLEEGRGYLPADYDIPLAEARIDAASLDSSEEIAQRFDELVENHPDNELYRAIRDHL